METITIKIKSKSKLQRFLAFINDLDYIEVIDTKSVSQDPPDNGSDFFAIKGMWEGRDVTAEQLRAKAWPKRK